MRSLDLFAQPSIATFTVSELANKVKQQIEGSFAEVQVKGEVSGLTVASSGHVYFNLKDAEAVLASIIWRPVASSLPFKLTEGTEVLCSGKLTTYKGRSMYQLIITKVEIAGIGALLAMLEERKKQMAARGWFAIERKKPLPLYPKKIAVITSKTGAVIQDIINRITERYPLHIYLYPVLVQGPGAAEQIANAIKICNAMASETGAELIIVARGGGSTEDLLAFNEEIVCEAVYHSTLPVISAVGHETDTTLIDYVADKRAATPTAAAEMATPVLKDLQLQIHKQHARLIQAIQNMWNSKQAAVIKSSVLTMLLKAHVHRYEMNILSLCHKALQSGKSMWEKKQQQLFVLQHKLNIKLLLWTPLQMYQEQIKRLTERLQQNFYLYCQQKQQQIDLYDQLLCNLNHKNVLKRGFAIVRNAHGSIIDSQVKAHEINSIEFVDGVYVIR